MIAVERIHGRGLGCMTRRVIEVGRNGLPIYHSMIDGGTPAATLGSVVIEAAAIMTRRVIGIKAPQPNPPRGGARRPRWRRNGPSEATVYS